MSNADVEHILAIEVEVSQGVFETLEIPLTADPVHISSNFVHKFNLPVKFVRPLARRIRKAVETFRTEVLSNRDSGPNVASNKLSTVGDSIIHQELARTNSNPSSTSSRSASFEIKSPLEQSYHEHVITQMNPQAIDKSQVQRTNEMLTPSSLGFDDDEAMNSTHGIAFSSSDSSEVEAGDSLPLTPRLIGGPEENSVYTLVDSLSYASSRPNEVEEMRNAVVLQNQTISPDVGREAGMGQLDRPAGIVVQAIIDDSGEAETIHVGQSDNPERVAEEFCVQNGIRDESIKQHLESHIREQLAALISESDAQPNAEEPNLPMSNPQEVRRSSNNKTPQTQLRRSQSIFDRLHRASLRKTSLAQYFSDIPTTKQKKATRNPSQSSTIFSRLYDEGLRRRRSIEKLVGIHERLESQSLQEATFKPLIGRKSKQLARQHSFFARENYQAIVQSRMDRKTKEMEDAQHEQLKQCTFRPIISESSKRIVEKSSRTENAEERLYFEGIAKRVAKENQRKRMMEAQDSQIHRSNRPASRRQQMEAIQRLMKYKQEKLKYLYEYRQRNIDRDESGKPLFKSQIERGPSMPHRDPNLSLWEYLHTASAGKHENTKAEKDCNDDAEYTWKPILPKRSRRIWHNMLLRYGRNIFDQISETGERMSTNSLEDSLSTRSPAISSILGPIVEMLKSSGENSIDFPRFIQMIRQEIKAHPSKGLELSLEITRRNPSQPPLQEKRIVRDPDQIEAYKILYDEYRFLAERRELLRMRRHDRDMASIHSNKSSQGKTPARTAPVHISNNERRPTQTAIETFV